MAKYIDPDKCGSDMCGLDMGGTDKCGSDMVSDTVSDNLTSNEHGYDKCALTSSNNPSCNKCD
jgi:hypothetical protein